MTDPVLVALGSNLPDRAGRSSLELCRWAVDRLAAAPGLRLVSASAWYRTRPIPASDQPDYVNGVVHLTASLDPAHLLAHLHSLEAEAGRIRGLANAARTLDLDLLACADLVVRSATLTLPHPRLQQRAFVLRPLCDVAPEWRHPLLGRTASQLLDALPPQPIERIAA